MYKDFLEKVFKYLDKESLSGEIQDAKKEYFDRIGSVFEGDSIFEMRMASFFDWFIFNRPMKGLGLAPIRVFAFANENILDGEEKTKLSNMLSTVWSIFLIEARMQDGFKLRDLFDNREYMVSAKSEIKIIEPGSIIEARLIPGKDCLAFSDSIFTHPREVARLIFKQTGTLKLSVREEFYDFIFRLAAMSIRLCRYRHLPVGEIYSFK